MNEFSVSPNSTTSGKNKKKRNLPGTPDPEAEVIALSPNSLLATNRFVCDICSKGFQRDQNLQLHRRGHNLPWKLQQKSSNDHAKKRVYVCPESNCVHHDPSRALGDLTGIKKHFSRKHGEKKWKCEKCSKKYAVQSDWKAHSKVCGSREYKCDCGTLFTRKDSFITHRAFCDALAEESAKVELPVAIQSVGEGEAEAVANAWSEEDEVVVVPISPPPESLVPTSNDLVSSVYPIQSPELPESPSPNPTTTAQIAEVAPTITNPAANSSGSSNNGSLSNNVFASLFASSTSSGSSQSQTYGFSDIFRAIPRPDRTLDIAQPPSSEPISLGLGMNHGSSIFRTTGQHAPAMSATALLQKAAQMGASASNSSLLRGLGIVSSSSSPNETREWSRPQFEPDSGLLAAGLGLGLAGDDGGSSLKELMLGAPSCFGPKQATLDLLGLGVAASGSSSDGLSALVTLIGGALDVAAAAPLYGGGKFGVRDMGSGL